jgi:hypothetical protein
MKNPEFVWGISSTNSKVNHCAEIRLRSFNQIFVLAQHLIYLFCGLLEIGFEGLDFIQAPFI